jgi:hypothetical protein
VDAEVLGDVDELSPSSNLAQDFLADPEADGRD